MITAAKNEFASLIARYYTAWYWFVLMALGDTLSRRVPQYLSLSSFLAV